MTSAKLLQLARALTHCDFEDEILLMWLSHCENTLLTEVLLLSKEECRPIEAVSEEDLTVPHPYDKLYLPYLQAQIHHAFGETDKYENFMALYNAYRDEYARKILSEIEPAYGEAIAAGYYLTAYGIAKSHGYLGTEEEWLRSLQGISPRITIGEVRSGNVGESAEATITGTDTDPVLNLVLPRGAQGPAGAAELGVAVGVIEDGVYIVSGDGLPYVKAGHNGAYEGKGKQIVFVPKEENPAGAALQINGGDTVEIRMRSSGDQLTEALPAGVLRIGVPYTMTFCGMYWLVDSVVALQDELKHFALALKDFSKNGKGVGLPVLHSGGVSQYDFITIDTDGKYPHDASVPSVEKVQRMIRESVLSGYIDVTEDYEKALATGTVTCAREYLWMLGEGRYSLSVMDKDDCVVEKYYLHAFHGEFNNGNGLLCRILIRAQDFYDIEFHNADNYDSEPVIMIMSETGHIYFEGRQCNPTDLTVKNGKLYLSHEGIIFGDGVTLPQGSGGSGIYIGSGDMPEGYNVQIDPEGEVLDLASLQTDEDVKKAIEEALEDFEPPESGGGIEVSGAKVGDFLKVKEVDENGVPTAWETAEMPVGDEWELITDFTSTEEATLFTFSGLSGFRKISYLMHYNTASANTANQMFYLELTGRNGVVDKYGKASALDKTYNLAVSGVAEVFPRYYVCYQFSAHERNRWYDSRATRDAQACVSKIDAITKIAIGSENNKYTFGVGTRIILWGVKA